MIELAMMYGLLVGSAQVGPYFIQENYLYYNHIYTVVVDTE
jgi:hypothetical protein